MSSRNAPAAWAYFDTSVLVKRYVREGGARLARELLRRHRVLSCGLAPLEALSAFSCRRAAGELNERSFGAIVARLRADRDHWELVEVNTAVLGRAEEVMAKAQLRALDALHIASAAVFQELSGMRVPFITADERQREAAQQMNFQVTWVPTA